MVRIAEPIYGGYVETNDQKDFMEICNRFYYDLFGNEMIFVSFDFFTNEENYELENPEKEEPEQIEYYRKKGGFDTWVKLTGKEDDRDIRFMHLATNIVVKIEDGTDKLIMVKGCEYRIENFANWFSYSVKGLVGNRTIRNAHNLLLKRAHIYGTKNLTSLRQDVEERLESETPTFVHDTNQNMDVRFQSFMDGNDLTSLHLSIFNQLDRESYELGRVSNTNPKGERYSTGESYKDITGIAARQKGVLKQLKLFAKNVKEFGGLDLNFAVNGIPETELIPQEQQKAAKPNGTEKPDADAAISPSGK